MNLHAGQSRVPGIADAMARPELPTYPFRISYGANDDRLRDFYIPALERSVRFDRTTGLFSSAALAVAAAGIVRLIQNGGRMRLLCGARLSIEDVEVIRNRKGAAGETAGNRRPGRRPGVVSGGSVPRALLALVLGGAFGAMVCAEPVAPAATGIELVRNGGFEDGAPGSVPIAWSRCARVPAGAVLEWTIGDAHSGKRALRIRSAYEADRPWFWWQQMFRLRGAKTLEVSAFIRSRDLSRGAVLVLRFQNAAGRLLRSFHIPDLPRNTAGWVEVRKRIAVPAGAVRAVLQFSMHGSGSILLDDLRVAAVLAAGHGSFARERVAPVLRTPQPVRIDGRPDEWAGVPELRVQGARRVSNAEAVVEQSEDSRGAADLSFAFRLTYDHRALYLTATVRDDVRRTTTPYWRGDSIQFALDTRWQRREKGYGPGDFAFGLELGEGDTPARVVLDRRPDAVRLDPGDVSVRARSQTGGYTVEVALPWAALGCAVPRHGTVMGFTILVNDSDGAGRKWAEWTPGIALGKSPARYGTLVFLERADQPAVFVMPGNSVPTDLRPLVVRAVLVSLASRPTPVEVAASLTPEPDGAAAVVLRQSTPLERGVTHLPFVFRPETLTPGPMRLDVRCGPARFTQELQIIGLRKLVEQVRARLPGLRAKERELADLIGQGRGRGLDVALCDATCVSAEYFLRWIPADLAREGDEELARRETERLETLVDRALAEVRAILANPEQHPAVPVADVRKARLERGNWVVDGRPVFLIGLNQLPLDVLPDLNRFGGNFVTVTGGAAAWTLDRGPEPDPVALERAVIAPARRLAQYPVRINVLFGHRMPRWAAEKYPDITAVDGHFMDYDIDHPAAQQLTCTAFEAAARELRRIPGGVTCYDVWNEAGYWKMSARGLEKFRRTMKQQYRSIAALNRTWGTDYATFAALKPLRDPQTHPAGYRDWAVWNDARVAEFARRMRDAVRRGDPGALVTMKITNEAVVMGSRSLTFGRRRVSGHGMGLDRWALARLFDIQGCDTRPTLLSPDYAFAWRYPGMAYDLQRSMAPGKPIDDSEWHGIQTVYFVNEDQPAVYLDAALWFSYLHGMDMNITWWWSRTGAGEPKQSWFHGSLLTQPQLLDAWARNNITVQRFAPEIVAFQEQRPRVRLLFSKPSAVLDLHYLDTLFACYESLSWFGIPVGFVTEQMLLDHPPRMDVLVIPAARHASDGVRQAVARLAEAGTTVVEIGGDCLTLDAHGRRRDTTGGVAAGPKLEDPGDPAAWGALLKQRGLLDGPRCIGPDGFSSKPVAFRTVRLGDRRLGYLLGLGKSEAVVRLVDAAGKPLPRRSLLSGKTTDGPRHVRPYQVDLFEFELAAASRR